MLLRCRLISKYRKPVKCGHMDRAYTLKYKLVNKKELLTEFFFVYN
ncbi:hypothetical protein BRYFOR_06726 [Marvinbryantia formatexigens DSM 14469]|uniref:Uncharacterized protein n=1 Tax=Marvinbryantia formatexigens DSM 14469 TaxID=478749 RepID=C6LDM8_9FIRM|nr:hypothetical protein BRYFOR_06726 [Marvinbryantia formatexigens DSM 14469]SDF65529.1 hypothetical protein SAMN05660368_01058 [Marvinbryantia formatexigens]